MKPEILLLVPIYAPVLVQLEQEFKVHKLWQASDPKKFMATIARVNATCSAGSAS